MLDVKVHENVKLRDVTLRDGLQLTGKILSTENKVSIIRELLDTGVDELEIGSMARGDLVPPLADTLDVVRQLTDEELSRCWIWVATPRHVEKAIAAGAKNFQYCFSASDSHNKANINRTTEESLEALPRAIELADAVGGRVQLCIATSFTCPFEGPVSPERVVDIVFDERTRGTRDVVLCDTIGQANPKQVTDLVARVRAQETERRIVFHGHDTWGLGVANSMAAVEAGADVIDGAMGGLGGCPFAPGASGNTSLEDLMFALRPKWLTPDDFKKVVAASASLLDELEEPNQSRAVQGAKASSAKFEWSFAS